jgi:hypothetical protein
VAEDRTDPGGHTCEADLLEQQAPLAALIDAEDAELERLRNELAAAEDKIAGLEAAVGSQPRSSTPAPSARGARNLTV